MIKISELTAKLAELPQMKEAKEVATELASDDMARKRQVYSMSADDEADN